MQKCQTPQFLEPPSFTGIWAPLFQVATQNSKIRLQIVFGLIERFPIWMSQPHSTKTHKEDRIPGNGLLPDQGSGGGPLGVGSPTQQYNFFCVLTVNIWPRFNLPVKSYSIYVHRQTDTFSIPVGRDEIFLLSEIYTFSHHYVHLFAQLTHSLRLRRIKRLNPTKNNCLIFQTYL